MNLPYVIKRFDDDEALKLARRFRNDPPQTIRPSNKRRFKQRARQSR